MNLRGWITFFSVSLFISLIYVPEVQALSKPCRLAISTLRAFAEHGDLKVPEKSIRYLKKEITSSMQPWMEDFSKLLGANGLEIARFNSAGIPVVESNKFHQGHSAEVLGELVIHRRGSFNPLHKVDVSELFDAATHPEMIENGAEFQTHDQRFYLALPRNLNEGFVLEMRSRYTHKVLAVAVPDGYEASSSRILYQAIQKLMLYRHWR